MPAFTAIVSHPGNDMSDTIEQDKFVSLTYTITDDSGDVLERTDIPISFIYGRDKKIIAKIEQALAGKLAGDTITIPLTPDDGFGHHLSELTFTDELQNVPPQFRHIGAEVEFQNDHGESRMFRVTHIEGDKLTVDGNHPFAGMTVTYNIHIQSVRDATDKEMESTELDSAQLH